MQQVLLNAKTRTSKGKEKSKKLRNAESIPSVVYGKGMEPILLEVSKKDFVKTVMSKHTLNVIINMKINNGKNVQELLAMPLEVQKDVFHKNILHIDFKKISLNEPIHVTVPIHMTGEAPGVKLGGVIDQVLWNIEIKSLPLEIPETINVDISGMNIGDSLHVKDLKLSDKYKIETDPDEMVAVVHAPKAVEEPVPAEAQAEAEKKAEPEVIKEKKEKDKEE